VEGPDPLFLMHQRTQVITTGCFEGMLVSREVVSQIGFPDPAFFIGWDDAFYGYLASRVTDVLYANVFVLMRKRELATFERAPFRRRVLLSPLFLHHLHKNRFLIARALGTWSAPFWWATVVLVFKGLFRELVIVRSFSRARAIVAGVMEGINMMRHRAVSPEMPC
jgi:GT2 family glycosyltransferase